MKSYLPGSWYAVLGEQVTLVLPPAEKHRVAGLWDAVDAGAGFDEVLDRLLAGGLSNLSGFGLVGRHGETVRALFRGNARVVLMTAEGPYPVDGTGAATWSEAEVAGVGEFVIELDAEVLAPHELVIGTGLVRVARISAPADGGPVPAATIAPEPVAESTLDPIQALPLTSPPAPPSPPSTDHDGHTSGTDPLGLDVLTPGGLQPPAPVVTAHPVARLLLSTGDAVDVDRAVLFGRAPEARRFQVGEEPRLITVPSPHQEISSTHLEIRPGAGADHGTAVVTDLGSTNGTVVVQPGLGPEELQAGIAVQLIPGAIVDLGDGVTIQVINP